MAAPKNPPRNPRGTKDRMPKSVVQNATVGGYGVTSGIDNTGSQVNPTQATGSQGWAAQPGGSRPIPTIAQESYTKPTLEILGAAGTSFYGGLIQNTGEYNPQLHWRDWVEKVSEMLRSDVQVRALQELLTNTILAAEWKIKPASEDPVDVEIASFVETALLEDIRYTTDAGITIKQDFKQILRHILLMVPYGFSPLEVCWRQEDDGEGGYWLKLAKLQPLLPITVYRWWVGRDVELEGIQTWAWKDYAWRFTNIPASKLLLFVHDQQGQNYEGLSALRPAFQAWFYKQTYLKIAAIAAERNGLDIPVITLGVNATQADANSALALGQNMRVSTAPAAVVPNDWKLEYPRIYQNHAESLLPFIQYFDVLLGRAYHAPWVNLGSTEVGAYNLDASQKRTTLMAWQAIPDTEIIPQLQPLIEQLVILNYGEQAVYPTLECGKLMAQDVSAIADALSTQNLQAYLPPTDPVVRDYVAQVLGIPVTPMNQVETTNPTGPDGDTGGAPSNGDTSSDDGGQDEGDSEDDGSGGSGDGGGAAMSEMATMLSEALSALYAHDAVDKGAVHLGGHEPGYEQVRGEHGQWGSTGNTGGSSGGGRGRGGAAKGEGEGGGGGGGGGSGSGGKGKGTARAKTAKTTEAQVKRAAKAEEAAKAEGHAKADAMHQSVAEGRSGGKGKGAAAKAPTESIHETAARLQREGGLRAEVKPGDGEPQALHTVEGKIDPFAHDAAALKMLTQVYGEHQLGAVLTGYGRGTTNDYAKAAGVKPARTTSETVSRIVSKVTEGRYSANFPHEAAAKTAQPRAQRTPEEQTAREAAKAKAASAKADRAAKEEARSASLVPIRDMQGVRINPFAGGREAVESLRTIYGDHQLETALTGYSASRLLEMANDYGVKRGRTNAETIRRIVAAATSGSSK